MAVTIAILSQGSLGPFLASAAGVRSGPSLPEISKGADAVLAAADCGLDFVSLRAGAGQEPALFLMGGIVRGEGRGFLLLCPESGTSSEMVAAVADVLESVAEVRVVSLEQLAVAVRFLAAAPALMTVALEGLEGGAIRGGLPVATTRAFGRQTLLGTVLLLEEEDRSPADLKDKVASPGGTTITGLSVLEEAAVRGAYIKAVLKIYECSFSGCGRQHKESSRA